RGGQLVHPAGDRDEGHGNRRRARRRRAVPASARLCAIMEYAMDGERLAPAGALVEGRARREGGPVGRTRTLRWLVIVGLLLAIVLGGLYGFYRLRDQAIATYFANNKPPPAQISAVEVKAEAVPRFATGIGAVPAGQQVTISPG